MTEPVNNHQVNQSGNCVIEGCPCRGWSAQESVNTCVYGFRLDEPCRGETCTAKHEPAARGGGDEWRTVDMADTAFDPRPCWTIEQEGQSLLATAYSEKVAHQIVTEHNQHQSLVAERERLRSKLEEVRSTLGGLRNHLRPSEDERAKDYIRFMFEQIDAALNDQKRGAR